MSNAQTAIIAVQTPFLCAYESAKQAAMPFDTPIAVVRNNQVIDLSPTALRAGAAFHLPLRALRHAIPNLETLPYNTETYRTAAEKICATLSICTPVVEPLEPHLVMANLTGCPKESLADFISTMRATYALPVYVGIASTRAVALCAAAHLAQKAIAAFRSAPNSAWPVESVPFTEQVLTGKEAEFLAPLNVQYLIETGLPEAVEIIEQLINLGVMTFGELAAVPLSSLILQFGAKTGPTLRQLAYGKDPLPVKAMYPPDQKSAVFRVPAESDGLSDAVSIDHALIFLSRELSNSLADCNKAARALSLEIRQRAETCCISKNLKRPAQAQDTLLGAVRRIWADAKTNGPVHSLILRGMNLAPPVVYLGNAFADNTDVTDGLTRAMQSVNNRFGVRVLQRGENIIFTRRELVRRLWEGENL